MNIWKIEIGDKVSYDDRIATVIDKFGYNVQVKFDDNGEIGWIYASDLSPA